MLVQVLDIFLVIPLKILRHILDRNHFSDSCKVCLDRSHCEKAEMCMEQGSEEFARVFELDKTNLISSPKVMSSFYVLKFSIA